MANFISGIISLTVGVVILANVFIVTVKGVNQSYACGPAGNLSCPWNTSEIAMWGLLTLISIVGMIYGVLNVFGLG